MNMFSLVWRFLSAGLIGSVLTAVLLPPSAWIIGIIREGDQLHVANTSSAYYFLSLVFLYYAVPISFFVSAISAVDGRMWCGALLGIAGTAIFAMFLGKLSASDLGLMVNGAAAVAFICCGLAASGFQRQHRTVLGGSSTDRGR